MGHEGSKRCGDGQQLLGSARPSERIQRRSLNPLEHQRGVRKRALALIGEQEARGREAAEFPGQQLSLLGPGNEAAGENPHQKGSASIRGKDLDNGVGQSTGDGLHRARGSAAEERRQQRLKLRGVHADEREPSKSVLRQEHFRE